MEPHGGKGKESRVSAGAVHGGSVKRGRKAECSLGTRGQNVEFISISSDSSDTNGSSSSFADEPEMDGGDLDIAVATLYDPYRTRLEFFGDNVNWGPTRWVLIEMDSGRAYRVKMERKSNYHVFSTGWDLVVAAECLGREDKVFLEYDANRVFLTLVHVSGSRVREPGFAHVINCHGAAAVMPGDYYVSEGTEISRAVMDAMKTMWTPLNQKAPMYVCTIRDSQKKDGSMFFSKDYSKFLPKKETIALRLSASQVSICGSVHKYETRTNHHAARITQGWSKFVEEHGINGGDVLVFRCYRGPNVWEMMVCRVGGN